MTNKDIDKVHSISNRSFMERVNAIFNFQAETEKDICAIDVEHEIKMGRARYYPVETVKNNPED